AGGAGHGGVGSARPAGWRGQVGPLPAAPREVLARLDDGEWLRAHAGPDGDAASCGVDRVGHSFFGFAGFGPGAELTERGGCDTGLEVIAALHPGRLTARARRGVCQAVVAALVDRDARRTERGS